MAPKSTASASSEKDDTTAAGSETESRNEVATKLVDRFAIWSGVAGLVPIPVVDLLAVGGLQVQMLRRLSQIYDVEFSENRGKAVIAALAGTMIPATSGPKLVMTRALPVQKPTAVARTWVGNSSGR